MQLDGSQVKIVLDGPALHDPEVTDAQRLWLVVHELMHALFARLRATPGAEYRPTIGLLHSSFTHPVLSVWQTDIIHYGTDLVDYIHQECGGPGIDRTDQHWNPIATVAFWRDFL